MHEAKTLSAIFGVALGAALLCACTSIASATPPEPIDMGGDNAHFYSASTPTYASVDGRRTIAFNALLNIYAVTTKPEGGGAPQVGPTLDVDEKCGLPGFCVRLLGIALSGVPRDAAGVSPKEWSMMSGKYRLMRCLDQAEGPKCGVFLVSYDGKDGVRGWYVLSLERGVESFGRLNSAGASEDVFVLFAERGVLFRR